MFKSDFATKRTWDPESGWELFDTTDGPDYPSFELRHPSERPIAFWGKTLSIENTGDVLPNGTPIRRKVFEVCAVNERTGARALPEERRLIEEALYAYGGSNNGPTGPVEVLFAD